MSDFLEPIGNEEAILQNILGANNELLPPMSRNEKILLDILGEDYPIDPPMSRMEALLIALKEKIEHDTPSGKITITANATDINIAQYATADVAVPTADLGTKSITANGTYAASADNLDGYSSVTVAVPLPDEYAIGGSIAANTATGYYCKRGITNIVPKAFQNFTNLESIDMPDTVETIGDANFFNLQNLGFVRLPANLITLGGYAFCACYNLEISELPNNLATIGLNCFMNCRKLNFESIPNSVTSINGFTGCINLELKNLSQNITTIPNACFSGCEKLQISKMPSAVSTIGENSFYRCYGITSLVFEGTPSSINATAFNQCNNLLNIYVPWSENAVAGAPWGAVNATITYDYTGV